jgi:hypothetical protein
MKMKRRIVLACVIVTGLACGWIFRPYPEIDQTKVHPALRDLPKSARSGFTSYSDGGSMAVEIERPDGTKILLCLAKSSLLPPSETGQLYIGARHFSFPGATKIVGYDHTRFVIARLLASHIPEHPYVRKDIALLTKRTSDWISALVHGDL